MSEARVVELLVVEPSETEADAVLAFKGPRCFPADVIVGDVVQVSFELGTGDELQRRSILDDQPGCHRRGQGIGHQGHGVGGVVAVDALVAVGREVTLGVTPEGSMFGGLGGD